MTQRIVILGGGTGGTLVANRLRRRLPRDEVSITVVDRDDAHVYQPGLLFVPFGQADPEDLVKSRRRQFHRGIDVAVAEVDHVDLAAQRVVLRSSPSLAYDVLIVATGAQLAPGETEGLTGPGWNHKVFTFYTLDGAWGLAQALDKFEGGHLIVNVVDMPIKCPVAPLEFCFLADAYFSDRGMRDAVTITYVTPLDGAFTKPVAADALGNLLAAKGIQVVTEFNTASVDGEARTLTAYDGRTVDFDLAVVVPVHGGADYVGRSPGLGDALNFVDTDPHTMQARGADNVFVVGDAANVPTSKAGSVAHFEGDVVCTNVIDVLAGRRPSARFDGHANCFVETGHGRALLIDFNYDTEPLPGRFPMQVGLPLLHESRLNHIGKEMFGWFYWHSLLPGHDIPGIGSAMPERGKHPVGPGVDGKGGGT